jgi:hypothetical protein
VSDDQPRRVRVTADPRPGIRSVSTAARAVTAADRPQGASDGGAGALALPGTPVDEADAVYSRALRRTQLRLALGVVIGFVVIALALTLAIAGIPELDRVALWGVPLSWLVHALAFYPVIFGFALLYARAADRNEARYRALRERE